MFLSLDACLLGWYLGLGTISLIYT